MVEIRTENKNYLLLFLAILSLLFLFACNKMNRTDPIIHFFEADSTTITEGGSVTLSWEVTEATAIAIDPDIGLVDLSGSLFVSPVSTITYTLTATNSCGQLFFPAEKTDTLTIQVNPVIHE